MAIGLNVGSTDKLLRLGAGAALIVAAFLVLGGLSATGGIAAIVIGLVLIVTALVNFCPLYKIFKFSTR